MEKNMANTRRHTEHRILQHPHKSGLVSVSVCPCNNISNFKIKSIYITQETNTSGYNKTRNAKQRLDLNKIFVGKTIVWKMFHIINRQISSNSIKFQLKIFVHRPRNTRFNYRVKNKFNTLKACLFFSSYLIFDTYLYFDITTNSSAPTFFFSLFGRLAELKLLSS